MKKTLLFLVALFLPLALAAKTTVIYHTSDTHGFYYPKNGQGGFAALKAVLNREKLPYLLLDSGDFANGTVEAKNSKGLKSVVLMNAVGYQASTIGNHEFDFKDPAVEPMIKAAKFPILAANFYERKTDQLPPLVRPYEIYNVGGVKYAVIGMANTGPTQPTKQYKFKKDAKILKETLKKVEAENPDVVVLLDHNSVADDKHGSDSGLLKLATKEPGKIDIVLGGHAHKIIQNHHAKGTLFVESGCYTQNVSKITVETDDKTGKFVSAKSELIALIVAQTGEDEAVKALADQLREPGVDEKMGEASSLMSKNPVVKNHKDSPLNNWIADFCRRYAGTEIFIHNNGGTRVDMEKGPVTRRDIIDVHPFDNYITRVTVSGKFLKNFVKKSLLPRSLYTYSGMTVTYKRKGNKVKDLKILVDGKPVENHKTYTIATNSYIAGGGSEGWMFKQIPADQKEQIGDKTIRDLMEEELVKNSPVAPGPTGRIIEF